MIAALRPQRYNRTAPPLSSSGPGRRPLTAKTGVRFPLGAPIMLSDRKGWTPPDKIGPVLLRVAPRQRDPTGGDRMSAFGGRVRRLESLRLCHFGLPTVM